MLTLVCGPPCSGKTMLARQLAAACSDGQVLDFDDIAVELGSPHRWAHAKPLRVQAETLMQQRMRRAALSCDRDSWVIRSLPEARMRAALARRLDAAQVLVLDPGFEACVARAGRDGRPVGTVAAIRRWYTRYSPCSIDTLIGDDEHDDRAVHAPSSSRTW